MSFLSCCDCRDGDRMTAGGWWPLACLPRLRADAALLCFSASVALQGRTASLWWRLIFPACTVSVSHAIVVLVSISGTLRRRPCTVMNATGQPEALCGIGINFRADKTGALLVSSLIEGGILRGWTFPAS